jgi:thiol:disulfide interchange protein DsbC
MSKTPTIKLAAFMFLASVASAHAMGPGIQGCSSNCIACHSITKEEAQSLITAFSPGVDVTDAKPSPVRGLFQAMVHKGKEEGIIYIDYAKKYLINAQIFDTGRKTDVTREELINSKRIDPSAIKLDNTLVLGNPKGSKKLIVFTDPECPYCAQLHKELLQLVKEMPELQINIILFPLEIHPTAAVKVDSIVCRSKSSMTEALTLLDRSFDKHEVKLFDCGSTYSKAGTRQADELGISVTPTMVLPDGRMIMGMKKAEEIRKLLVNQVADATAK